MTRNFIFCLFILLCWYTPAAYSQARLVLNGAQINITNTAMLVIDNPQPNALTRFSGSIVSEGENNAVKWNIGNTTGTYTIPWGYGTTNYLPLTFTKTAGTGAGTFTFSTYHTGWQNTSFLPTGVTDLGMGNGDNSIFVIDRFWQINPQGYTGKPSLTNLSFGYLDIEHSVPNNIIGESNLGAQRWNDNTGTWSDMLPAGTVDIAANTVTISALASTNLFKWWTLVDANYPLPVRFLSFRVQLVNDNAKLFWTTTAENNVNGFEVQKSTDGVTFNTVGSLNARGGTAVNLYEYTDAHLPPGKTYYRIKENDSRGQFAFTDVIAVTVNQPQTLTTYPNPVNDKKLFINTTNFNPGTYLISLFDLQGRQVFSTAKNFNKDVIKVEFNKELAKGTYLLKVGAGLTMVIKKVVIN